MSREGSAVRLWLSLTFLPHRPLAPVRRAHVLLPVSPSQLMTRPSSGPASYSQLVCVRAYSQLVCVRGLPSDWYFQVVWGFR